MSANIEGASSATPGTFVLTRTQSRGVSIPTGTRLMVLMGEGQRDEILIASAVGGGNDGLDPTCTTTSGSDGRHFKVENFPVISNRSQLFKNGIPLTLLEDTVDTSSFDSRFDARIDITTGCIELQTAALVDQGGSTFSAGLTNIGNGTISGLTLLDVNAPTETWTARVSTVRRDGYGVPIDGYAKFVVQGAESGILKDGYGNIITWQSDGVTISNGILSFAISEGSVTFREGDTFVIQVDGGILLAGDSLTVNYIGVSDINDPELFTDAEALRAKHGAASLENRLALGAQVAFANSSPALYGLQTRPAVPRRQSHILEESAEGEADIEDLQFALPLNVIPDTDSNINFFLTDPVTGVETQILPNKVDFFDSTITASPATFHFGAGFDFSYTVILDESVQKEGDDGVIVSTGPTTGTLSSAQVSFGIDDLSATRSIKTFNASVGTNNGTFAIVSIASGVMTVTNPAGFTDETGVEFQVLDSVASSAIILFTDDLALTLGQTLRATVVDSRDADFFDPNWTAAYTAAEKIEVDMVIPLPSQTISAIFQAGKAHVEFMSDVLNRKERMLFIGAIRGLTPANVIGTTAAAVEDIGILEGIQGDEASEILAGSIEDLTDYGVQNAFGDSFRTVFMYPDEVVLQIGADRELVDGFFMAPAAGAFFSATDQINRPITNKTLGGFTILRDKLFPPLIINDLAANGITVLQPVVGGGRVVWGKTTTNSGFAEEEEISIIFIRDRISKSMRGAFQGFIGTAETPTFEQTLFARATAVMQSFLSQRLITDFRDLVVSRDEVESRQWNIRALVQPVFPTNWIRIDIGIGTL